MIFSFGNLCNSLNFANFAFLDSPDQFQFTVSVLFVQFVTHVLRTYFYCKIGITIVFMNRNDDKINCQKVKNNNCKALIKTQNKQTEIEREKLNCTGEKLFK